MTPSSPKRARPASKSKKAEAAAAPKRAFTAHHLVPPHELLSESETQSTLAMLKVPPERLPKILVTDPGLQTDPKYVTAREAREPLNGRIVRIRRPSATAGESIAYRIITSELGD
jgi:DNA-directed RNA polymerase subunit H (RpoH/RPB5)